MLLPSGLICNVKMEQQKVFGIKDQEIHLYEVNFINVVQPSSASFTYNALWGKVLNTVVHCASGNALIITKSCPTQYGWWSIFGSVGLSCLWQGSTSWWTPLWSRTSSKWTPSRSCCRFPLTARWTQKKLKEINKWHNRCTQWSPKKLITKTSRQGWTMLSPGERADDLRDVAHRGIPSSSLWL